MRMLQVIGFQRINLPASALPGQSGREHCGCEPSLRPSQPPHSSQHPVLAVASPAIELVKVRPTRGPLPRLSAAKALRGDVADAEKCTKADDGFPPRLGVVGTLRAAAFAAAAATAAAAASPPSAASTRPCW